jgi:hypothetical protein
MSHRRQRKRSQRAEPPRATGGRRLGQAAAALAALVILSTGLAGGLLLSGLLTSGPSGPRTAAIVDQLGLTQPNPDFAERATSILEQAGYAVDYYPGEDVTVNFYRNLPTHGHDLIILRVHSGLVIGRNIVTGSQTGTDYVALFTSEPYSDTRYSTERLGRLGRSRYHEGGAEYFGIAPNFIRSSMTGRFDKTTIILMGCDGLKSLETADAFLERGAQAFVSWSGPVSATHTDAATENLLQHLLIDGLSLEEAIAQTTAEVGPDPSHGSTLLVHPPGG